MPICIGKYVVLLPICLEFREANKKNFSSSKIKNIIKRGWPGKTNNVLERQTDLVVLSFYGFVDHVVHIPKSKREKKYLKILEICLICTYKTGYSFNISFSNLFTSSGFAFPLDSFHHLSNKETK